MMLVDKDCSTKVLHKTAFKCNKMFIFIYLIIEVNWNNNKKGAQ